MLLAARCSPLFVRNRAQSIVLQHSLLRLPRRLEYRIISRPSLWERDDLPDRLCARQDGNEPVETNSQTSMGWCTKFEGLQKMREARYLILIQLPRSARNPLDQQETRYFSTPA